MELDTIKLLLLAIFVCKSQFVLGGFTSDGLESSLRKTRGAVAPAPWSYSGGPSYWPYYFHSCAGKEQSPINIETDKVGRANYPALKFYNYNLPMYMTVKNNGHSVELEPVGQRILPYLSHGGLPGVFIMHHLHFHWGATSSWGSEHKLNSKPYPLEVHIVHYNRKYKSINEAKRFRDGLAVLAIFAEVSDNPSVAFSRIDSVLDKIPKNGQKVQLASAMKLNELLPTNVRDFFRYHGSLTTPVCTEVVTWTIFRTPIKVSERQLVAYRTKIYDSKGHHLLNNFRPVQAINHRKIYVNQG